MIFAINHIDMLSSIIYYQYQYIRHQREETREVERPAMEYNDYSSGRDHDMVLMGAIIREIRQHCGARQAEIAERAIINSSYLSALENGIYTMSLRKYLDLCKALQASPVQVMTQFCERHPVYSEDIPG